MIGRPTARNGKMRKMLRQWRRQFGARKGKPKEHNVRVTHQKYCEIHAINSNEAAVHYIRSQRL